MSLLKKLNSLTKPSTAARPETPSNPIPGMDSLKIKDQSKAAQPSAPSTVPNTVAQDGAPAKKPTLQDFVIDRTLGTGSFGRVHLVKSKTTSRYCAMKVLKKADVVKMKQVEHTVNEKTILENVNFPFLVNSMGSFQDSKNLYIVLEYVSGGELFTFLRRNGVCSV